jgi:hypothetical protein
MLRFEEVPYSRRRDAGLMTFFDRTNYGRFEPVNNAIINFNKYCNWFGFCSEVGRDMFQDRMKSALSGERFGHRRLQLYYIMTCKRRLCHLIFCFNPVDQVVLYILYFYLY